MTKTKSLEERVKELEKRVRELESKKDSDVLEEIRKLLDEHKRKDPNSPVYPFPQPFCPSGPSYPPSYQCPYEIWC